MIQEQVQNEKPEIYKINFTLNEIRELVLSNIDVAQDTRDPWCLTTLKIYNYYHEFIEEYFKIHKEKSPSMPDKLAYIILLSYPKRRIQEANSLYEFKLFQDKFSDFEIIDVIDSKFNTQDDHHNDRYDCICSYPRLEIIYIVENKYTGIRLQIGSKCIKKYKIISEEELKRYEQKRKDDREKISNREKYEEKQRKKEEKLSSGKYRNCLKCSNSLINIKTNKDVYLCKNCLKYNKTILCRECSIPVILNIESTNIYCSPCEERKCKCIDCSVEFIRKYNEERCFFHQTNYENMEVVCKCEICDKDFTRKNKENWRTFCRDCLREFPDCIYCSKQMSVGTSNTPRNPGRKYFACKNSECSNKNKWTKEYGWIKEYFEKLKAETLHNEGKFLNF